MMGYELVSIIIATYNSAKHLGKVLEAIRRQNYPQDSVEILIVDGGSSDETCTLAQKNGCIVLHNPKTEPVHAKLLGLQHANGKYILFLDHDEVMENSRSISRKVDAIQQNPQCHVVLGSGYKRPQGYPRINQYISEYGDPFSLFLYNFSKYDTCLEKLLLKYYRVIRAEKDYICIDFAGRKKEPIIELCCLGTMLDNSYFSKIPHAYTDGKVMTHLFYVMLEKGDTAVICMKDDALLHYSADSVKAYLPKLKWRVCNNIHFPEMGESGVSGRLKYQKNLKIKRYFFVPYALLILPALLHGMWLAVLRRNPVYLLHPYFSFYVVIQIIWQSMMKVMGIRPRMKSYDGKKEI
ncbi:MAG: glycosyltransferase family 2 protein [Lachnospiraceae bacterium]|nr:glycosyltransferase family 2 protein [Lachnospiraceae bacterium]